MWFKIVRKLKLYPFCEKKYYLGYLTLVKNNNKWSLFICVKVCVWLFFKYVCVCVCVRMSKNRKLFGLTDSISVQFISFHKSFPVGGSHLLTPTNKTSFQTSIHTILITSGFIARPRNNYQHSLANFSR